MKIVMLGHSGAGKTTYVASMYRAMQDEDTGFRLRATKATDHRQLLTDAEAILTGRYPAPTHQRAAFSLVLQYRGRDVLPFQWRDYRGGALRERGTDAQAAVLRRDLKSADGIVVFADAVSLRDNPAAGRDVGRLVTHIHRALDARGNVLVPLVVALTKCDLVDLEAPGVAEVVHAPFTPLVEAVRTARHVSGTTVHLACGRAPANVAVPVLWVLHIGLKSRLAEARKALRTAQDAEARAQARASGWNTFTSFLQDKPSWAQISNQHRQEAEDEEQAIRGLRTPRERLGKVLKGLPSY